PLLPVEQRRGFEKRAMILLWVEPPDKSNHGCRLWNLQFLANGATSRRVRPKGVHVIPVGNAHHFLNGISQGCMHRPGRFGTTDDALRSPSRKLCTEASREVGEPLGLLPAEITVADIPRDGNISGTFG